MLPDPGTTNLVVQVGQDPGKDRGDTVVVQLGQDPGKDPGTATFVTQLGQALMKVQDLPG